MTEEQFLPFREQIIGIDQGFESPYGKQKILYADWIASGRMYGPIEERIRNEILPFVGNTHTETTVTGTAMTKAYHKAKQLIKKQVNASDKDVLIFCGSGMTGAINKMQRILGLKVPDRIRDYAPEIGKNSLNSRLIDCEEKNRPVVFITHMEHHSNHTSWLETIVDLEIIQANEEGLVDLTHFEELLKKYIDRKYKIASVTACSNVTGLETPYHEIAKMIHAYEGICFVDFACSGPYVDIDMHPKEEGAHLDAVFLSPHKFLGGPGTPGIAIFNSTLYHNRAPDIPGGGTVLYTSPWYEHRYISNIEDREDGGTPPFIQGIRAAMAFKLKEEMGAEKIKAREHELVERFIDGLEKIEGVTVLAGNHKNRLGAVSFTLEGIHYNLGVKILNDRFGIQMRGGCACAGTYGHYLLGLDQNRSKELDALIMSGDLSVRPGWIRASIHPTMLNSEIDLMLHAIQQLIENKEEWGKDYTYNPRKNEFDYSAGDFITKEEQIEDWFSELT
ncbi:MAG: aminotransferase class V-fold PLP-dependent enzyme [Balneola sp.]